MKGRVVRSSGKTGTRRFKTLWQPQGYGCLEPNNSLKVGSRKELYCPTCEADGCLFGGLTPRQRARGEGDQERPEEGRGGWQNPSGAARRRRAAGLDARGNPLKETCWNCSSVRENMRGYVCRHDPTAKPVTASGMVYRTPTQQGCKVWEVRLTDVEYL